MYLPDLIKIFSQNVVEKSFFITNGLDYFDPSLNLHYTNRAYKVDITQNKISKFFVTPIATPLQSLNLVGEVIFDHLNNKVLLRKKMHKEHIESLFLVLKDTSGDYFMVERPQIKQKKYNKPLKYVTNNH